MPRDPYTEMKEKHERISHAVSVLDRDLKAARQARNDFYDKSRAANGDKSGWYDPRKADEFTRKIAKVKMILTAARDARRRLLADFYNCHPGNLVIYRDELYKVVEVKSAGQTHKPWIQARRKTKASWHKTSTFIRGDWEPVEYRDDAP